MEKTTTIEGTSRLDQDIGAFIKNVDLSTREVERTELVDGEDAVRYNQACDYSENTDYLLAAIALAQDPGVDGKKILEIGMGPGNLCFELIKKGAATVIGADPSEEMIEHARKKSNGQILQGIVDFVPESVYDLPSGYDSAFDLVVMQNGFHQLHHPLEALEGMVWATQSGGQVHILDFRRDITPEQLRERIGYTKQPIWQDLANSICASLTKAEFGGLLDQIGGISYSVANAQNPANLGPRATELIQKDPVPHHRDFNISQKVVIYKQ
jgi:ubiquinone/menaquinone biosynthesis C-methylase UbiE|tara:strand:- start:9803 stop:10609 length:807 start_codon:yes stop_codon:yes gene_type:complete